MPPIVFDARAAEVVLVRRLLGHAGREKLQASNVAPIANPHQPAALGLDPTIGGRPLSMEPDDPLASNPDVLTKERHLHLRADVIVGRIEDYNIEGIPAKWRSPRIGQHIRPDNGIDIHANAKPRTAAEGMEHPLAGGFLQQQLLNCGREGPAISADFAPIRTPEDIHGEVSYVRMWRGQNADRHLYFPFLKEEPAR